MCVFLSDTIREKSILPYKHSTAMQSPEGTTNTRRLAPKSQQEARASVCEVEQKVTTKAWT